MSWLQKIRSKTRATNNSTNVPSTNVPSPTTAAHKSPPLAQENEEVESRVFEGLDQADGYGGDSNEEDEEDEIHYKALTKSLLHHHAHSNDFMACENILAGDIAFVLDKKEVIDAIPENILDTVTKPPSD